MTAPQSLEEIIRRECLPLRDCMLTVTDPAGEAAFLYFKEGELIEANYAALWGKDALAQIVTWKLDDRTIAPLPLGIKRSLWDRLEFLLNPGLTTSQSGRLPSIPEFRRGRSNPASPFDRYKAVPGLLKMVYLEPDKETVIFEGPPDKLGMEDTEWLIAFSARVKEVGETLGFGRCEKWTVDTERYQVLGLNHEDSFIALLRRKDAVQDDLETVVEAMEEA
jgi:hypothetical protein